MFELTMKSPLKSNSFQTEYTSFRHEFSSQKGPFSDTFYSILLL